MRKLNHIEPGTVHKAGEDYLETVLVIQKEKGMVRSVDIAQHLNISKPSVSNGVSVLSAAGYLIMDSDHFIHLTEEGRKIAERIYERHQFFSDFLVQIGVDRAIAEADACKMEHAISTESFRKVRTMCLDLLNR